MKYWSTVSFIKKAAPEYWRITIAYAITVAVESVLPIIFFDQIASWSTSEGDWSLKRGIALCIAFFVISTGARIVMNQCIFAMDDCITKARSYVQRKLHRKLFAIDYETTENERFWRENQYILHMADTSKAGVGAMMQQLFKMHGLGVSLLFSWVMLIRIHNTGLLLLGMLILWHSIKKEIAVEREAVARQNVMDRSANYILDVVSSTQYAKEIRVLREWEILKRKLVSLFDKMTCLDGEVCRRKFTQRYFFEHILFFMFSLLYMYFVYKDSYLNKINASSVFTAFFLLFTVGNTLFRLTESIVLFARNTSGIEGFSAYDHTEDHREPAVHDKDHSADGIEWDLKNISYCYPNRNEFALKNLNVQIRRGEKVAVVGLNGAGKSTLIKCMTGLYKNYTGCIVHNGNMIQSGDIDKNLGVLFQDAAAYPFTLEENVTAGDAAIDHSKAVQVLEQVGLMEKFRKEGVPLTECIDKLFSDTGIELSGGESKRLLLARLLYKNPDTILLDEPASSLDPGAQKKIMTLIMDLFQDKTVIVVTHRLEMLDQFERILVLENGSLAEDGKMEDLLKNKGRFCTLVDMQENRI